MTQLIEQPQQQPNLATIDGVTRAIADLLMTGGTSKPSPMMNAAFTGVLSLIEKRAKGNQQIAETVSRMRELLNIEATTKE